jgi:predicted rRNA methylase YqxC with S4 and FtsJ domains
MARKARIIRASMGIVDLVVLAGAAADRDEATRLVRDGQVFLDDKKVAVPTTICGIEEERKLQVGTDKKYVIQPMKIVDKK